MVIKQVIIIRKDLNMRKGKMIAQGAHASMKVFFDRSQMMSPTVLGVVLDNYMYEWVNGLFTKIVIGVNSEEELLLLIGMAKAKGIPCSLIQDAGITEFHGNPTYTAGAIGPYDSDIIDKITGNYSLL